LIWLLSILLAFNLAEAQTKKKKSKKRSRAVAQVNLTKVGSCSATTGKKVLLIKQWDLLKTTSTKGFKEKYAQERNLTAIYKKLDQDVKAGKVQLIVAEGCEGEIKGDFDTTFNGWDLAALQDQVTRKGFDKIITSVPLKIKAKHGDKVRVHCGDDLKQIQESNRLLSNLRGWTGYWSKFEELKNRPDELKPFADSAAALLKVPATTPAKELGEMVKKTLKAEVAALNESMSKRDDAFIKILNEQEFETAAVVVGGLHTADLKSKLEQAQLPCDVLEPPGYTREEENLIQDFQNILKK